jgi:hypothetical protein
MPQTIEELELVVKDLQASMQLLLKKPVDSNVMESAELNALFTALAKAQAEMKIASREVSNPFFKSTYSDLPSLIEASRPYLTKNGLCVIQRTLVNGNSVCYLSSRLGHSSGQWIEAKMPILPAKQDIQSIGSYITYLRRYTYACLVGVASGEGDDDGEALMDREPMKVSEAEFMELMNLLDKFPKEEHTKFLKWAQVDNLRELTREKLESGKKCLLRKLNNANG